MPDNAPTVGPLAQALSFALIAASCATWSWIARRVWRRQPLVEFEPRYPVPWSPVDVVLLAAAMVLGTSAAVSLVAQTAGDNLPVSSPARLLAYGGSQLAWLAMATVLLAGRGAYADDLGLDFSRWRDDLRLGTVGFLAALVPVFAVQALFVYVLGVPSEHPLVRLSIDTPSPAILAVVSFVAVVVAPLVEEFGFRVLLQGWLESEQARRSRTAGGDPARPGFAPTVIVSLVFAALHADHGADPFALFVLSLFLGYVYRQTHRIVPSLVLHALLNGWTMLNLWIVFFSVRG